MRLRDSFAQKGNLDAAARTVTKLRYSIAQKRTWRRDGSARSLVERGQSKRQ